MAQRLALIVAPRYLGNRWLAHLDGTRLLPPRLKEVLAAYGHYEQIVMDLAGIEVTRGQLRNTLQTFFKNSGELLFYFYGHGVLRDQREGVLATSDSEPGDEGVSMLEVLRYAERSAASEVVIIFDCCHAGAAVPVATATSIPQHIQPDKGRVLIAACAEHEQGWEIPFEDERRKLGALSVCVLAGLGGEAQNAQGEVTAIRLGEYVVETFNSWRQHPIWTAGGSSSYRYRLTWGFGAGSRGPINVIPPPEPRTPPDSNGFVGRVKELAYFTNNLSTDHIAVIAGEPGVGKTTLAAHLARQLAKRPDITYRIFWHQFHEGEGIETVIWQLAGMLYHHGQPTVWTILDSSRQSGSKPPPYEVLMDYIAQQLRGQAYILCLDDFHRVEDDPLVDKAVERLQQILPIGSLKLILTSQHLPTPLKMFSFTPLGGLSPSDTIQLLAARNIRLSTELTDELYRRTDGNAELLALAIQALKRSRRPERIVARLVDQDDVETFLLKAVDKGLTGEQRSVMGGVAALLGHPGSRNAIEATLARGGLKVILRNLANRFLLREQDGRFAQEYLAHVIIQAFYYELLGPIERQNMHRRAGEYYEHQEPDCLRAALHYQEAGEHLHSAEVAVRDIRAAIGQGQARHLKRFLERLDEAQLPLEMKAEKEIALGELSAFLEGTTPAKTYFTNAVRFLETGPDREAIRYLIARASLGMGTALEYEDPDLAWTWAKRGLDAANGLEPILRAGLLNRLGSIHIGRSELAEAVAALEEALVLIPIQPPNPMRTSVLINLNIAYGSQGNIVAGNACAEQALALAQALNDLYALLTVRSNLGLDRERMGDWPTAANDYLETLRLAEQMGALAEQVRIHNLLGTLLFRQGHDAQAVEHFHQAHEQARGANLNEHLAQILPAWAHLLIRQQRWAEAEAKLQASEQLAVAHDWEYILPETYMGLAMVKLGRGQLDDALKQAETSAEIAHRLKISFDEGRALHAKGQIYLALNGTDEALAAFQQSVALLENSDKVEALRVSIEYGKVLIAAGQVETGQALISKAQTTRKALGLMEDVNENSRTATA